MSLTITATTMSSSQSPHTARRRHEGGWEVSWLPGRILTQNQAVTAMTIAETAATRDLTDNTDTMWPHLDNWATELGLSGPDAVARASESPELRAWREGK
jgi:hypothetical protein